MPMRRHVGGQLFADRRKADGRLAAGSARAEKAEWREREKVSANSIY
jgi:hypothetical protein